MLAHFVHKIEPTKLMTIAQEKRLLNLKLGMKNEYFR